MLKYHTDSTICLGDFCEKQRSAALKGIVSLQNAYVNQLTVRQFIWQLMALPILPHLIQSQLFAILPTSLFLIDFKISLPPMKKCGSGTRFILHFLGALTSAQFGQIAMQKGWHHAITRIAKVNSINTYLLISLLHY